MGLVEYERYRGASLTERGRGEALRLVRRHRLIETFLLEHLGYSWRRYTRRPSAWSTRFRTGLRSGWPSFSVIPAADGSLVPDDSFPLGEAAAGQWVRIAKVSSEDASVLDHLGGRKLVPGRIVGVREVRDLDGVVTVEDEDGESHALGESLARSISVRAV
jgi:DtxR family Mn-dependent transcriptional regulator